jgi:hypothetical protein
MRYDIAMRVIVSGTAAMLLGGWMTPVEVITRQTSLQVYGPSFKTLTAAPLSSGSITGVVGQVKLAENQIVITTKRHDAITIHVASATPLNFKGKVYRISALEPGDHVRVALERARSTEMHARSIDVVLTRQDAAAGQSAGDADAEQADTVDWRGNCAGYALDDYPDACVRFARLNSDLHLMQAGPISGQYLLLPMRLSRTKMVLLVPRPQGASLLNAAAYEELAGDRAVILRKIVASVQSSNGLLEERTHIVEANSFEPGKTALVTTDAGTKTVDMGLAAGTLALGVIACVLTGCLKESDTRAPSDLNDAPLSEDTSTGNADVSAVEPTRPSGSRSTVKNFDCAFRCWPTFYDSGDKHHHYVVAWDADEAYQTVRPRCHAYCKTIKDNKSNPLTVDTIDCREAR